MPFVKHVLHEKITKLAADQPKPDQTVVDGQGENGKVSGEPASSPASQEPAAAAASAPNSTPPASAGTVSTPTAGAVASSSRPLLSSPHRRPKQWDEITVGDLVLAYDGETEGWFDAIVLGIEGELLRLRWRDYPLERIAPQRRDHLALLPPTA